MEIQSSERTIKTNLNKSENISFIKDIKFKIKKTKKKCCCSKNFINLKKIIILIISIISIIIFILILKLIISNLTNKSNISSNFLNNNNQIIKLNPDIINILKDKINDSFEKLGFVNINLIESEIPGGRKYKQNKNKFKEVNVGVAIDSNVVLQSMLTICSLMDSQFIETKLRLHFAVIKFSVDNMLKIYTLREKIRDDVEFNFYNARKVEFDLSNFHPKGLGILGKYFLPELLKDDVERIIIIDVGDVLVLRDLTEMYNWDMEDKIFCGSPDMGINRYSLITRKPFEMYINTGHYLVNVRKAKENKIYDKIVENKNLYTTSSYIDQDLFNDMARGQIGYLPFKFGINAPYERDNVSDFYHYKTYYDFIANVTQKEKYNFLPNNQDEMNAQAFNPVIIHQWNGKWQDGSGLTIYRRIAQYYIKLAGIWDEMCYYYPGYCKKQTTT